MTEVFSAKELREMRKESIEHRNANRRKSYAYSDIGIPIGERPCGCMAFHSLNDGIRFFQKSRDTYIHTEDDAEECLQCGASWRLYDRVPKLETK